MFAKNFGAGEKQRKIVFLKWRKRARRRKQLIAISGRLHFHRTLRNCIFKNWKLETHRSVVIGLSQSKRDVKLNLRKEESKNEKQKNEIFELNNRISDLSKTLKAVIDVLNQSGCDACENKNKESRNLIFNNLLNSLNGRVGILRDVGLMERDVLGRIVWN